LKAVTSVHNTSAEGWVKSTGFEYMSASSKEDFNEKLKYFMSKESDKALFFEVFCD
jgi:2-succinyl-5-enolpyruvyl-6-hydroxy-3-cyclohexene-1-carboxylate synthase